MIPKTIPRPSAPAALAGRTKLKAERIQVLLRSLPGWKLAGDGLSIEREFVFSGPDSALAFAGFVASAAREAEHFPLLALKGAVVGARLTTEEAGGVTDTDFELARRISLAA